MVSIFSIYDSNRYIRICIRILNLYIPRKIDELNVEHYTDKGNLLSSTSFLVDADIILDCNGNGDYYILEAKHGNNDLDKIKIFIYQTKNGE